MPSAQQVPRAKVTQRTRLHRCRGLLDTSVRGGRGIVSTSAPQQIPYAEIAREVSRYRFTSPVINWIYGWNRRNRGVLDQPEPDGRRRQSETASGSRG
jgi:hypothetical protein